jgi:hypothetical protein
VPVLLVRCVVHASFIHSDREILRFSHDLSIAPVKLSSIVTEYRTIQGTFDGAPDRFFEKKQHHIPQSLKIFLVFFPIFG